MKKKILLVLNHLTIGGVQKTLITASKNFDYEKYDITIYLRKNRMDLLPYIDKRAKVIINDDKHHYYRKPYCVFMQALIFLFKKLKNDTMAKKYEKRMNDKVIDYMMTYEHKRYFESELYDVAISYVHGYPALFVHKYVNSKEKIIFFRESEDSLHEVHSKIIDNFDKVLALHEGQKELIAQWYPVIKDRIELLENYTDRSTIVEQSKAFTVDKPKNKMVLCCCGRIEEVKGFDIAVEAAKILKENGQNFIWYFVGDGSQKDDIKEKIYQYNLQDYIVLTGMQKNPYPYMAACDIYVQPSLAESLGNTIVEANKLNKAVVSTATVGGKKLILNEFNGLLCDINAHSLAQCILRLISDPTLKERIEENLRNIDDSGELKKYKQQWKNVLEG